MTGNGSTTSQQHVLETVSQRALDKIPKLWPDEARQRPIMNPLVLEVESDGRVTEPGWAPGNDQPTYREAFDYPEQGTFQQQLECLREMPNGEEFDRDTVDIDLFREACEEMLDQPASWRYVPAGMQEQSMTYAELVWFEEAERGGSEDQIRSRLDRVIAMVCGANQDAFWDKLEHTTLKWVLDDTVEPEWIPSSYLPEVRDDWYGVQVIQELPRAEREAVGFTIIDETTERAVVMFCADIDTANADLEKLGWNLVIRQKSSIYK